MIEALLACSLVMNVFFYFYLCQIYKDQKMQWEAMKVLARGVDMCLRFDEQTIESVKEFRSELDKSKKMLGMTIYTGDAQA